MSQVTVGKWCGYCGHWVETNGAAILNQDPFIHHLHDCERRLTEKIRKDKGDTNDKSKTI